MEVLKITDKNSPERLASALRAGKIAVFPTDTVYGLGCLPVAGVAERIFEIKSRSLDKPLPLLIADLEEAISLAHFSPAAKDAAAKFWPGPVTLILKSRKVLPSFVCREGKVALRIPAHSFLREVIRKVGQAISGTSANLSGEKPPGRLSEIPEIMLAKVDVIIDGGEVSGKASSVYDLTGPNPILIRP